MRCRRFGAFITRTAICLLLFPFQEQKAAMISSMISTCHCLPLRAHLRSSPRVVLNGKSYPQRPSLPLPQRGSFLFPYKSICYHDGFRFRFRSFHAACPQIVQSILAPREREKKKTRLRRSILFRPVPPPPPPPFHEGDPAVSGECRSGPQEITGKLPCRRAAHGIYGARRSRDRRSRPAAGAAAVPGRGSHDNILLPGPRRLRSDRAKVARESRQPPPPPRARIHGNAVVVPDYPPSVCRLRPADESVRAPRTRDKFRAIRSPRILSFFFFFKFRNFFREKKFFVFFS